MKKQLITQFQDFYFKNILQYYNISRQFIAHDIRRY